MELPETLLEISLSDQKSQKRLKKILKKRFLDRTWSEWEVAFADCDACVELVREIFPGSNGHQQFKDREMFVDVPDSSGSTQRQIASPFKFSSCKPEYGMLVLNLVNKREWCLKNWGIHLNK
ncbi:MAG: hypothetical protein CM1200mP30_31660 [Pseudomonadota bacterium]|nr:MAG: hypothetical protein CM1200mP30_31660 [Pseudomonadota bacterium]